MTDIFYLCHDCGSDLTDLAPGEDSYGGFVVTSDGKRHHSRCIVERELAHATSRLGDLLDDPKTMHSVADAITRARG